MTEKKQRGGKREGAGRPKSLNKIEYMNIPVRKDVYNTRIKPLKEKENMPWHKFVDYLLKQANL